MFILSTDPNHVDLIRINSTKNANNHVNDGYDGPALGRRNSSKSRYSQSHELRVRGPRPRSTCSPSVPSAQTAHVKPSTHTLRANEQTAQAPSYLFGPSRRG